VASSQSVNTMKKTRRGETFTRVYHAPDPRRWARGAATKWDLPMLSQWRRSVVKYWGQGQSGQANRLLRITPYVSDLQTLNNRTYFQESIYPLPPGSTTCVDRCVDSLQNLGFKLRDLRIGNFRSNRISHRIRR